MGTKGLFAALLLATASAFGQGLPPSGGGSGGGSVTTVHGTAPIVSDNSTTIPTLSCAAATGSIAGCLSASDWTLFNAKQATVSGTAPIAVSSNTISCIAATGSVAGCLSAADWTAFNAKQATISVTAPIALTGATLSCVAATGSVAGCLSAADWTAFNAKQATLSFTSPLSVSSNTVSMTAAANGVAGYIGSTSGAQSLTPTFTFLNAATFSAGLTSTTGAFSGLISSTVASGSPALQFTDGAQFCLDGATCQARLEHTPGDNIYIHNVNGKHLIVLDASANELFRIKNSGGGVSTATYSASNGSGSFGFEQAVGARFGFNGATHTHYMAESNSLALFTGIAPASDNYQWTGLFANSGNAPALNGALTRSIHKVVYGFGAWGFPAALTSDITIGTIPAKSSIVAVYADTTQAYAGTGMSGTIQVRVGTTSGGTELILAHDVKTAAVTKGLAAADLGASIQVLGNVQVGATPSWSTQQVFVRLASSVGNIGNGSVTNLTAGSTTFYIVTETMP